MTRYLIPKFYDKQEMEFLRICSFELLTWKLLEVCDRVLYEWIVEIFK